VAAAGAASARKAARSNRNGGVSVGGVLRPPPTLTDGTIVLRELREGDRADVLATMRDPLVVRWLNMPTLPTDRDFDSLLRLVAEGRVSGERIDYTVTEDGEDRALGAVIASRRHRDNYELAYLAGPGGRGRGVMTRAVRILCDWLFAEGVGRIELRTHPSNEDSQRLAERCGFRPEGRERKSIWLHGRREDALLFSLLPEDPR
jgi:RimJ/RimL family protein N-acetyltransferase